MKKFAVVIVVFMILLSGVKEEDKSFSLLDYFSGEYTVYTSQDVGENSVDLGFCYMNNEAVNDYVIGESVMINNLEVSSAISTLKARVVKTEMLEDGTTVIYAYTSLINEKVDILGENVNLQIATKDDRTIIGWPLIMGSF